MELFANVRDGLGDNVAYFVEDADFDGPLATNLDLTTDSGHELGPGADGFAVVPLPACHKSSH